MIIVVIIITEIQNAKYNVKDLWSAFDKIHNSIFTYLLNNNK